MWLVLGAAFAGWEGVEVAGELTDDFQAIDVSAACSVELELGAATRVSFTYQSEKDQPLTFAVTDGVLTVRGSGAYRDCKVTGTYQRLAKVKMEGAAHGTLGALDGSNVTIDTDGAATLTVASVKSRALMVNALSASTVAVLAGSSRTATFTADGASSMDLTGVRVESAKVTCTSASAVELQTAVRLEARATGASTIAYSGGATDRVVKADLTSTISKR